MSRGFYKMIANLLNLPTGSGLKRKKESNIRSENNVVHRRRLLGLAAMPAMGLILVAEAHFQEVQAVNSTKPIIFAYQDRVADAASIIAVNKGFFKSEGLNVEGRMFTSGPSCAEALIYGNAVLATMGDTTAIITLSKSCTEFRAICSHGGGEHRHRIIVRNDSGITLPQHLVGKRIGVKKGTSTHGGLLLFAQNNGLELKKEIIDIKPSLQLIALAAGQLDAMVASEPTPTQAEVNGFGRQLSTLGGQNNTYPIFILANNKFAQKNPETIVRFLKIITKAGLFLHHHPDEAALILSGVTGLEKEVIRRAMANHYYHVGLTPNTVDSVDTMAKFLRKINKIKKNPDFNTCLDDRYLKMIK
jgi:ABC-type nitrate/sulfonate/bicarbonate transport system substrate-binding protein